MTEPITITGLAAFNRRLRQMDADLPKGLRVALNQAAELVIADAAPKVPRRTGRAAASLRGKSTRTTARVAGGARRAPYYPWLDFGGRVGRNRSVDRPFFKKGRYLWKSYAALRDDGRFEAALRKALVGVATGAGVEVSDGG